MRTPTFTERTNGLHMLAAVGPKRLVPLVLNFLRAKVPGRTNRPRCRVAGVSGAVESPGSNLKVRRSSDVE
jgi:hypothetical protein